jgi:hypothetical protein
MSKSLSSISGRSFSPLLLLLLMTGAAHATNGGIDTPTGITTLPIAVQGTQGLALVQTGAGTIPYFTTLGSVSINSNTAPLRKLDVYNGLTTAGVGSMRVYGYQPSFEVFNAGGTANWYFGNNDADNNALYIGRGYGPNQGLTPSITVTQSGQVGINTTVPGAPLAVQMNDNTDGNGIVLVNSSTGVNAQAKLQLTQGANTSYVYQQGVDLFLWGAGGGDIDFFVNNGAYTAMTMRGYDGHVGIGTTNPAYILDVMVKGSGPAIRAFDNSTGRSVVLTTENGGGYAAVETTNVGQIWDAGVQTNGYYSIGPANSWAMTMSTAGNMALKGGISQYSDERLKKDVTVIDHALDKIATLRGVTFNWKDKTQDPREQMGVIAQDVEKVFPDAVTDTDKGFKTVNYSSLIGPLIESVKELKADNADLRAEVEALKQQVKAQH